MSNNKKSPDLNNMTPEQLEEHAWKLMRAALDKEQPERKVFPLFWIKRFAAAACVVALLGMGIVWQMRTEVPTNNIALNTTSSSINNVATKSEQAPITKLEEVDQNMGQSTKKAIAATKEAERLDKIKESIVVNCVTPPNLYDDIIALRNDEVQTVVENQSTDTSYLSYTGPTVMVMDFAKPYEHIQVGNLNVTTIPSTAKSTASQPETLNESVNDLADYSMRYGNSMPMPTSTKESKASAPKAQVEAAPLVFNPTMENDSDTAANLEVVTLEYRNPKPVDKTAVTIISNADIMGKRVYPYALSAKALTREWSDYGGWQAGVSKQFRLFNTQKASIETGLEYTRFQVGISKDASSAAYSYFDDKVGEFTNAENISNFPGTLPSTAMDNSGFLVDNYGQYVSNSAATERYLTTRTYIGVPVLGVYQMGKWQIRGGGAVMLPLNKQDTYRLLATKELRYIDRSSLRVEASVTRKVWRSVYLSAGWQQGVSNLSTGAVKMFAPQRSLFLGCRYQFER